MSLYSDRVALDSPLFYFENNSSGVNNTGSITPTIVTGSSTTFTTDGGVQNGPYLVNAARTGEYGFEYSDSTTIFNDRVFSITGWFKVASADVSSNLDWIFHPGTTGNGVFLQKTDRLYVGAGFNNIFVSDDESTAVSYDAWHHVAVTMDTTNLKLYVDGSLVDTKTSPASLTIDSLVKYWMRATTSGTPRNGVKGNFDEWAVFNTALSATTIEEHYEAGFGVLYEANPATASALAVDPTLSLEAIIIETPATASAASGDHYNSTVDGFTTLNTYLSTLPLEQWYRFDEFKNVVNYGTGGTASLAFGGNSTSEEFGGIQGSGALRITGSVNDGAVFQVLNDLTMISPEITDGDFSVGFWVKADSAVADNNSEIWNAVNTANNRYNRFTINDNGTLSFQMNTNSLHQVVTTESICDDEWHFVVGKYDQSDMYLYVDGILIGDDAVNYSNFSPPNLMNFGSNGTAASGDFFSVSQFFISSSAAITTTVIDNIIDAAQGEFQAYAAMEKPKLSFNNSFNNLTETRGALVDLRFNEPSGAPVNFGTTSDVSFAVTGGNITYGELSPNTKAYKITNTNAKISRVHEFPSGTFSTEDEQTLMAYVKFDSAPAVIDNIAISGHFGGDYGSGLGLLMTGAGNFRARLRDGSGFETLTTSGTYVDSKYHLVAATTDGSTFKLYVDGVQIDSTSTSRGLTDKILLMVGGEGDTYGLGNQSKSTTIDEVSVYNYAFTAEQIFNHFQALSQQMDWTATALAVNPSVSAGFGPTIEEPAMLADAELPKVFPFIPPMTADGLLLQPNFEAIKNVSQEQTAWTASAQGENPGWDIGENNQVLHMDASASFPDARAFIPGFWNANPFIANPAEIVEPAISSTLGALIKAEPMTARAILPTPPAYKLLTDDIWYSKLYLQHSVVHNETGNTAGSSSAYAFLKLFDDVTSNLSGAVTSKLTNNLPFSIVTDNPDSTSTTVTFATASNEFLTATPEPLLEVGTYDDYERKAVRFRNTQFKVAEDVFRAEGPYSLEFTFKSTKSNQVIAQSLQRSFIGFQSATSSIGLVDGKLFATRVTQELSGSRIFAHPDNTNVVSIPSRISTAYGNKRIDDGAWHHIIIQHGFDGRVQFWIDGQLDIQFFGDSIFGRGGQLRPYIFGSNHTNTRWQSDFETSAWSYDAAFFVESDQIIEHYTASIKYEPVAAEVATATAQMREPVVAGNRPRALMLYFWPTTTGQVTNLSYANFTSNESPEELETIDYFTSPPQEYQGWDVFPVDVTGRYVSDLVKEEAYGVENIQLTTLGGTVSQFSGPRQTLKVNKRRTFRDALTDAPRYIDLINDIDLSKFDMIMFKNYPNDPAEKDSFTGTEVVDEYFNLRESAIFEEFVKSLRAAVDTGLSLIVANAQLALDLKIVDRVETVPDMDDNVGQGNYSDPYSPTQMFGIPEAANLPVPPTFREPLGWQDTWKNNRTRIVNTHPDITDYPSVIKTQQAFWQSTDEFRWGGADRIFYRYENKDALAVGDEFVISTTGRRADDNRQGYLATPFENVKAGKIVTAFANTVRRGLDEIENPYRNYAQSIILEPGDVLDGTQVGGKIFVNFTEEINKSQESAPVELISDYWVNYVYDIGVISLEERDELLAADYNQDTTPYWSLNGMNLLQQAGQEFELDTDLNRAGVQKAAAKIRKVNKNGGISFRNVPQGSVFFSSTYSWRFPVASLEIPSMLTRGFRWLSNREVLEGTVLRPQAFAAAAEMPNAAGVPDREIDFNAQAMVATAAIEETQFSSGERKVNALPMEATATIVKPGSTIGVEPMVANAGMFANSRPNVASEDQVVLYLMHTDPILYIREDVIK